MRTPLFDAAARKRTVSLSLNADLVEKARAAGLNLSRIAEAAIAEEYRRVDSERWTAEMRDAVRWADAYVAAHGLPFEDWTGAEEAASAADHAA